ncbi:MAG TPA: adenosine deaminase, partial [Jiangellaceae bacterium]|nr:adenosine deaminase [Jiangellaceae bacterium]
DAGSLREWFLGSAHSGSLERYLETFAHTVAVMQTREHLIRVASECVQDLASDGVVYAEIRYAPELHQDGGLSLPEVVDAVREGFDDGIAIARANGHAIRIGTLLSAVRQGDRAQEVAELAVANRDSGVVGFDIVGPEAGYPPTRQLSTFEYLRAQNMRFTIHAGEAFGPPSIWEAVQRCGASRIGHGVHIVEDIPGWDDPESWAAGGPQPGRLARFLRDARVPLELCPSSNVQTGNATSIATHPIDVLARLGFRVTVNTDNRLMSDTSMSKELGVLSAAFGYELADLRRFTISGMKSAFISFHERRAMIEDVIVPGYAALGG